jgi:ligand-binding sensor domain-containing protein
MRAWQTDSGLPQNSATAIAQTPDGYLWLGTEEGLVRFDGIRFTIFDVHNTPQLRSDQVSSLLVDTKGDLWIGANGGGLTRLSHGEFSSFSTANGLSSDAVRFPQRAMEACGSAPILGSTIWWTAVSLFLR